jgi:hypothetical protein
MVTHPRLGELLSKMVPLSEHDVEEILQEQQLTHRRFGEIALAWGLCQPEHVWTAWYCQLADGQTTVDLDTAGIDAQAAALLPAEMARRLRVIPFRMGSTGTVVATAGPLDDAARTELETRLHKPVTCVLADPEQVAAAIDAYYPTLAVAG